MKIKALLISALAICCTACYDYDETLPQMNEQEPVMSVEGLKVAAGADLEQPINLNTFEGTELELVKTVESPALNEGASIQYRVKITSEAAPEKVVELRLTDGKISKTDFDNAFRELFGKTPKEKELSFTFTPYFSDGATDTRINQEFSTKQKVTPIDLGINIETAYYIITDPGFGAGWNESAIRLEHSEADVYDDPVFSLVTDLPAGSILFMGAESMEEALADPTKVFDLAWGTSEAATTSGTLAFGTKGFPITIANAGQYKVEINMLENTFNVMTYTPTLYAVGSFNNWTHNANAFIYERTQGIHSGFVDMTGDGAVEFKFSTKLGWDGTNYGAGAEDGTLSTDGGAGNIKLEKGGIYLFNLNTSALSWKASLIENWNMIGSATPGGWDNDTELAYKGNLVWESTVKLVPGEFKFRANHDWTISLGSDLANLNENNGGNISIAEEGTYVVTLDLSNAQCYKATLTKK